MRHIPPPSSSPTIIEDIQERRIHQFDHYVITVNVQSKNSEPQTTILKINAIKQTDTILHKMKHGSKQQTQIDHDMLKP